LVLRRAVWQVAVGIAIGMAGAVAVGRLLRSIQFLQMGSADPTTLAPVTALLVIVSLTASLWPAWRAARLNPVVALRHE
jgi:putative ABC transport system permease protein